MLPADYLSCLRFAWLISSLLLAGGVRGDEPVGHDMAKPVPVAFSRDVLPIISENCLRCHGPDEKARKAKLRLDTREGVLGVVVAGKSSKSELIRRVTADSEDEVMPPPSSKRKLTTQQKETLRRWVDQGAHWGKHWAYDTLQRPPLPTVHGSRWCRNAIDRFVLARLEKEGLAASPEVDKETLIRRVTLDLTGLPPSLREVDDFLADSSADAYEKVVDRLLGSERYGERMAMSWLDCARYADTNGYQNDFARSMWLWRDWVIDAFNRNMPFDQFTIEQIAGDMLPGATLKQRIASGFNRNNRTVTEAGSIDEEWRVENTVDRVETTAATFLGLTMGCARCHDHKFEPISQKEFYRFFGFFNNVNEKGVYTEQRGNVPPLVAIPTPRDQARMTELLGRIALDAFRKYLGKRSPEGDKRLAQLRKEADSLAKQIPSVMVMEELPKPRDTYILKRGRYEMPDTSQKLTPAVPACLPSLPPGVPQNRLGLARWLVDPGNPLPSRVIVNRFWQEYFGVGLVKTAEDFGVRGEVPSHPELLDWLATEFIRSGWNTKAMQRLIVTSATYRQSSKIIDPKDPENRLLARGPRFRLPAETVRDNALAISGLMTEKIGGPSIRPYQPPNLWEELAGGAGEGPYVQDKGANLYRRSLYVYRKRTVPHPVVATFDAPSREICQVKRQRTNTPLQALELLNDVTYVEAARCLAQRMLTEGGATPRPRLTHAFRLATARRPSDSELDLLSRALERYLAIYGKDQNTAKELVHHGEAPVNGALDPVVLAAYTSLASVILNLDETITKE
jgi:Protein of unknown function (DUF1553)/Protein of unknown function (DUF1549)/Planctomycete cytochrome C